MNRPSSKPDEQSSEPPLFEQVHAWVLRIPFGKVMTYGQISRLLDDRLSAKGVGWAMRACPHDERRIPWHRVVNSQGRVSTGRLTVGAPDLQQRLLEGENIVFDETGRMDLNTYRWIP